MNASTTADQTPELALAAGTPDHPDAAVDPILRLDD